MEGMFIIAGVMLVFSLIMGMDLSWNNVLAGIRNNLVFADRNKEYGAYQLRQEYTKRLGIAVAGSVILVLFTVAAPYMIPEKAAEVVLKKKVVEVDMTDFQEEEEEPPPPPPEIVEPPPPVEQVQFVQVEATNEEVDDPPPTQDELDTVMASTVTVEGVKEEEAPPPVEEDNTTYAWGMVEENSGFPGGDKGLLEYLNKNVKYPAMEADAMIQGTVYVEFVVDKDGSVTGVTLKKGISPGCDKEALRVIKAMPKWTPAKMGGRPVKQRFVQRIVFELQ